MILRGITVKRMKVWCDIILYIGILFIVIGLILPHTIISGNYQQGLHASINRTAIGWSFRCTGLSFVLLGSVFKMFIRNIETELNEIKYKLRKLEK